MSKRTGKAILFARRAPTRRLACVFLLVLLLGPGARQAAAQNLPTATTIADQQLVVGGAQFVLDLTTVFTDADNDALTFTAASNNEAAATAVIQSLSILAVTPVAAGTSIIILTADDSNDGQVQTAFLVTVIDASTPPTATTIADQQLVVGGAQFVLDLTTVFSDVDVDDELTFTVESSNEDAATAAIFAVSFLAVTPVAIGTATIIATATDLLGGEAQTTFVVTVTDANTPPTAATIADQQLVVGSAQFVLDLTTVFTDADDDALTFTTASNNEAAATAVIQNQSILTVTPIAAGTSIIIITTDDGNGGQAQTAFLVTVTDANTPPTAATIADQQLVVGGVQFVLDLTTVFTDADGDAMTFTAASTDSTVATVGVSGSSTLAVTAVAPGTTTIAVTASDSNGGTVQTTFVVTVTAANSAPVVANALSNQHFKVGDSPFTKDLNEVFTDPDGDALTFIAASDSTHVAAVGVSGASTLTIVPLASGTAPVTITANDGSGGQAQTTFVVTVNSAPTVVSPIANQSLDVGTVFVEDLSEVFNDPDDDLLTFTATSDNDHAATVGISSGSILTVVALATGTATITVAADDGNDGQVQTTFVVAVGGVNSFPEVINTISDRSLDFGGAPFIVDLTTVFTDPDRDTMTFSAASDSAEVATASISGTSTLIVTPVILDTTTITVTADDNRGGQATTSFVVIVGINQAPTADSTLADQQLEAGGPPYRVELTEIFSDPDGDALAFSATSSDAGVATAGISGTSMLTVGAVGLGAATITVTANDGRDGQAQTSFAVNVRVKLETKIFTLRPNYPNPFNPSTVIEYTVPAAEDVAQIHLAVYTMAGRLVLVLVNGLRASGLHRVTWYGIDAAGTLVPSGVYLYRLEAQGFIEVRQMLLVK